MRIFWFTVLVLLAVTQVRCDERSDPVDFIEFECDVETVTLDFCNAYMAAVDFYGLNARDDWRCLRPCETLLKKASDF